MATGSYVNVGYWQGSASFSPGETAYGYYDNDGEFQSDVEKFAEWAANRLGYPISDIELEESNFFDAFEEAVNEYSAMVNTYAAKDNKLNLTGFYTGSQNISGEFVEPNMRGVFKLAGSYGQGVGVGGSKPHYTGSVNIKKNQQVYDLDDPSVVNIEYGDFTTDEFVIRKLLFEESPSIIKYFDPTLGTGWGSQYLMNQFGWGGMSPAMTFMLMPIQHDVQRMQHIEMHERVRKADHSFKLTGNRLRIFPIPREDRKMFFEYTLESSPSGSLEGFEGGKISDHSNMPYGGLSYCKITEMGQRWIKQFALANIKETLGWVRSKYGNLPIPNAEITLNGDDLLNAADTQKEQLREDLKETLEDFSNHGQLERKAEEAEALSRVLQHVPTKIYVK